MTKRAKVTQQRRAFIAALAQQPNGEVRDDSGFATQALVRLSGLEYDSHRGPAAVLLGMEQEGLIVREKNAKRTYAIRLVEPSPDPRYQELIDRTRADQAYARGALEAAEAQAQIAADDLRVIQHTRRTLDDMVNELEAKLFAAKQEILRLRRAISALVADQGDDTEQNQDTH